jgi:hypothetical protein
MQFDEQDELDRILNGALSAYPAEPRLGIETRVLRRVRSEGRFRRPWNLAQTVWPRVVVASIFLAFLTTGVVWLLPDRTISPAGGSRLAETRRLKDEVVHPSKRLARESFVARRPLSKLHLAAQREKSPPELPRLEVFPTPSPLTREELALMKLARVEPGGVPRTARSDSAGLELIQIDGLEIKPLSNDGDE